MRIIERENVEMIDFRLITPGDIFYYNNTFRSNAHGDVFMRLAEEYHTGFGEETEYFNVINLKDNELEYLLDDAQVEFLPNARIILR